MKQLYHVKIPRNQLGSIYDIEIPLGAKLLSVSPYKYTRDLKSIGINYLADDITDKKAIMHIWCQVVPSSKCIPPDGLYDDYTFLGTVSIPDNEDYTLANYNNIISVFYKIEE